MLVLSLILIAAFITGTTFSAVFGDSLPYQTSECTINDKYFQVKAVKNGGDCIADYYFTWNVTLAVTKQNGFINNGPNRLIEELSEFYNSKEIGQTYICYYQGDTIVWSRQLLWPWILLSVLSGIFFLLTVAWAVTEYLKHGKQSSEFAISTTDNDL